MGKAGLLSVLCARPEEAGEARGSLGKAFLAEGTKHPKARCVWWRRLQEAGWWTRTEPEDEKREGDGWTIRPWGPHGLLPGRILAFMPSEIGAHGRRV